MPEVLILFCLILIILLAVTAAICRSMIRSAIALAAVSGVLAIIMFLMGATWAALFELSVCAGLVTVIFISAISLTQTSRHAPENVEEHKRRFSPLPFILILLGVGLLAVMTISGFKLNAAQGTSTVAQLSFKEMLWNTRQADILGQIFIILAGAFAVVILFKEGGKE